jgi:hypothetical protein
MTSIDVAAPCRPLELSKLWAVLLAVGLGLTFASAAELPQSPISCGRHQGAFSNDFSPNDFDINSVDCRVSWIKNTPTIRFWGVSPFVGIK